MLDRGWNGCRDSFAKIYNTVPGPVVRKCSQLPHIHLPCSLHASAFVLLNYSGVLNNMDLNYMDPLARGYLSIVNIEYCRTTASAVGWTCGLRATVDLGCLLNIMLRFLTALRITISTPFSGINCIYSLTAGFTVYLWIIPKFIVYCQIQPIKYAVKKSPFWIL